MTAINDPPEARDDGPYYTRGGEELKIGAASGVLTNGTDAEDDELRAILVIAASRGRLTLKSDGSYTYNPRPGFAGTDSFIYKANDDTFDSEEATVAITVFPDGAVDRDGVVGMFDLRLLPHNFVI